MISALIEHQQYFISFLNIEPAARLWLTTRPFAGGNGFHSLIFQQVNSILEPHTLFTSGTTEGAVDRLDGTASPAVLFFKFMVLHKPLTAESV